MLLRDTREKSIERAQRFVKFIFYSLLIFVPLSLIIGLGYFLNLSVSSEKYLVLWFALKSFFTSFPLALFFGFLFIGFKYLTTSYMLWTWKHRGQKSNGEIDKLSYLERNSGEY